MLLRRIAVQATPVHGFIVSARAALEEVAALPVRLHPLGLIEMLLVRSEATGRWIVPMTMGRPGIAPAALAAEAARKAAGLSGEPDETPFGQFIYERRLAGGMPMPCHVAVHVLQTNGGHDRPLGEGATWFRSREAARQVCNISLQRLIDRAGRSMEIRRRARQIREAEAADAPIRWEPGRRS